MRKDNLIIFINTINIVQYNVVEADWYIIIEKKIYISIKYLLIIF